MSPAIDMKQRKAIVCKMQICGVPLYVWKVFYFEGLSFVQTDEQIGNEK